MEHCMPPFARTIGDLLATPVPGHLYHYTSIGGLEGILSTKTLRATKLQYMNDKAELTHALSLARQLLREQATKGNKDPFYSMFLNYLADQVERIEGIHVCVFCLSEQKNLLSQWRAYCPPGGGYCLGLPGPSLHQLAASQGLVLGRCTYDPTEQRAIMESALAPVMALFNGEAVSSSPEGTAWAESCTNRLFTELLRVAPFMKDSAFSEEKEWRLVSAPLPDVLPAVRYRLTGTMLVPYLEIQIAPNHRPFPEIEMVLGPNQNEALARTALVGFLMKCGIKWSGLESSRIPYRQL